MCIEGEMRWFWPRNPTVSTTSEPYSGLAPGALLVEVLDCVGRFVDGTNFG